MENSLKPDQVATEISPLKRLKANFIQDFAAENDWRQNRVEYGRFYDGDQLSDEEKRELERRGQPPVVVNRIKPKLDAIFGIVQELSVATKAFPLGDRENEAAEISERFRRIENDSHFNEEELQVFKDQVIDGRGYFKTFTIWDGLEKRTITEHVSNHHIVLDRHCRRPDMKDAKRIHEYAWMDLDDAVELFPDSADELRAATMGPDAWMKVAANDALSQFRPDQYQQPGGSHPLGELGADYSEFIDTGSRQVRIVTTYHRSTRIQTFMSYNGETQDVTDKTEEDRAKILASYPDAQVWTQEYRELNSSTFCWNVILEEKTNLRPYDREAKFPITMAAGYTTREKEKHRPYGLVKQHLDPQREVNKRRSKMLHLLNVSQVWYEEGAFPEESKAKSEAARPDGWISYRKEFKVDRITHNEVAQAQFQLLQESKREIDQAGVNEELEGESRAQSGREFQLRLKEGLKSIRELMSNLRACRRRLAEYWLDDVLEDMKREAKTKGVELAVRKYDVVIEEAPDSVNLQSETFNSLVQLASTGFAIPPATIIKVAPLAPKVKEDILQSLQQAQEAAAAAAARGEQVSENAAGKGRRAKPRA